MACSDYWSYNNVNFIHIFEKYKMKGTITLKQAWESWRMIPQNMALATKCRSIFNDILLSMHGNMLLTDFESEVFTRDAFKDVEDKEAKIKVASILVYLMEYGASKGYCNKPSYDETIVLNEEKSAALLEPTNKKNQKSRKTKEQMQNSINIKEATDQQLYDELLNRGWKGELKRLEVLKPQK